MVGMSAINFLVGFLQDNKKLQETGRERDTKGNSMAMVLYLLLVQFLFQLTAASSAPTSKFLAGCPKKCGNISIPYPFGFSDGCYRDENLHLQCDSTNYDPPKLFLPRLERLPNIEITTLSYDDAVIISTLKATNCSANLNLTTEPQGTRMIDIRSLPAFTISATRNKYVVVGCPSLGSYSITLDARLIGCTADCIDQNGINNSSCDGNGCCQVKIPKSTQLFVYTVLNLEDRYNSWKISPCSYSFLEDQDRYEFVSMDIHALANRTSFPVALDWVVGVQTCKTAMKSLDYACGNNSYCVNSTSLQGYRCSCNNGFQGNPYLADGCQDINECKNATLNTCSNICTNTVGSYKCSCPTGTTGDGKKSGTGCIPTRLNKKFPMLQVILGTGFGLLFLVGSLSCLYWTLKKRRMSKLKEKFFKQNGGFLLQQQISSHGDGVNKHMRLFKAKELEKATNKYNEANVVGQGGYGTVYKGELPDKSLIAIKKSKVFDESQVEQFINEIVILSKLIHRNVVKILGCCLETQVPHIVYEFISNGSLHKHLHGDGHGSLPWEVRLAIAAETADALGYIHSSASQPIFHRDIKSANILLDEHHNAKVSDFGASRMVRLDQVHVTTAVQGTSGYLDPEYFDTCQLTAKSDVYSFGVVLVELLTGELPISICRREQDRNLAPYFLRARKEGFLLEIIEPRVKDEAETDKIEVVANVASQCLRLKGEERPSMKEVAVILAKLRRTGNVSYWNADINKLEQTSTGDSTTQDFNSTSLTVDSNISSRSNPLSFEVNRTYSLDCIS